jgi:hypothetical protein
MASVFTTAEDLVDKSVPYLVALLLVVIIVDFGFPAYAEEHRALVDAVDWFVIGMFTLDLAFKFNRIRDIPEFVRRYWLDILAVFPFYLMFRFVDEAIFITGASELVRGAQPLFHEATQLEKAGANVVKEAEATGKLARFSFLGKLFAPVQRVPRLFKAAAFYEPPDKFDSLKKSLRLGRIG